MSARTRPPCSRLQMTKPVVKRGAAGWRGRPAHGVGLLGLGFEDNRADGIDHHLEKSDVKRPEY
jgi:hypothetical protein